MGGAPLRGAAGIRPRAWAGLLLVTAIVLSAALAHPAAAQVSPDIRWHTLTSVNFRVHYSDGLERTAREALGHAENAYAGLSASLKAPRGRIDLVVSDNRDFANGYATVFPTNRVVIYTMPPTDVPMLRASGNWLENLIVHELAHIFHLDRVEGLWRVARLAFGRNPSMMPNLYSPSWIREGIAVYYESALTGAGRLASGEHHMIVRGAAEGNRLPRLGDLSLSTSAVPEGHTPYVFGARLIQALASNATEEGEAMERFISSMSASIIPYTTSRAAKKAFGVGFGDAWQAYRDSADALYGAPMLPLSDWRTLVPNARLAWHPRWLSADSLLYVHSDGRSTAGLYKVSTDGSSERLARRNGVSINVPMDDGSVVFTQPEYTDPYTIRSDIYRMDSRGRTVRLTHGARLLSVDARADGEMVAVQVKQGTSVLVRVSADGSSISPLTRDRSDQYWADPRWSPSGMRIAAVRRATDGTNALVVLDSVLRESVVRSGHVLLASPVWLDESRILVQTDSGRAQLAVVATGGEPRSEVTVTAASAGIMQPDVTPPLAGGSRLIAATLYTARGYELGFGTLQTSPATSRTPLAEVPMRTLDPAEERRRSAAAPFDADTVQTRRYHAWRYMIPRYWVPLASESGDGNYLLGGSTSAADVVDRHSYNAELMANTGTGVVNGAFAYSYAGLGNPVLSVRGAAGSSYAAVFGGEPRTRVGFLRERSRSAAFGTQFMRPRYRQSASASLSVDYEHISYDTRPAELLAGLQGFDPSPREFVSAGAGVAWSNTRRPSLSISPEDGISLSASLRERWRLGTDLPASLSLTGAVRAFKSLNLPGFSHHVLAARVAGGTTNSNATSRFSVGGKSGSKLEVFPGYSIGDVGRIFSVRGFDAGTLTGLRALAGSFEYRAPIAMPSRGLGMFPLFFDRVSLSLFADAGAAWCPERYDDLSICANVESRSASDWIASVGAELNLDAALQYDVPYRFRFGIANPARVPDGMSVRAAEFYFTLGFPF